MLIHAEHKMLLRLLRLALDNAELSEESIEMLDAAGWHQLICTATMGGVASLAFDGYVKSGLNDSPDCPLNSKKMRKLRLSWMGLEIPQRKNYERQLKVLRKLQTFFHRHGIEMQVLKGYPLSLCYPKPELRTASDIDIYCAEDYERSNKLIEKTGVTVDYSQHKHSVFTIEGVPVENHYHFLNVHGHRSSRQLEKLLHEKGISSPSATLLYLLRHSAENFTASQGRIRQVIDCGLYARKYNADIDWQWLCDTATLVGMKQYVDIVFAICVRYMGFSASLFPECEVDSELLNRSLNDILCPEFNDEHPANIMAELIYKMRRWRSNMWKHRIVYANENLMTTFLTQAWSHVLKPSSIVYGMSEGK